MPAGRARYDFAGRVAVVTGGSGGFGKAIAGQLLSTGASVVLWSLREQVAQTVASALAAQAGVSTGKGERLWVQRVDVTDELAVAQAMQAIIEGYGHIDTLVNNAGILGPVVNTWEQTSEQFRRVIDVNLTGSFICCRVVVP